MKTINQLNKQIHKSAPTDAELRYVNEMAINQFIQQGDIYIQRVEKIEKGKKIHDLQLAPGTTKGSRHILADFKGDIYTREGDALTGPAIEAKERFTLTHPEHAHYSLPAGKYVVTYQRDFEQEQIQRVRD